MQIFFTFYRILCFLIGSFDLSLAILNLLVIHPSVLGASTVSGPLLPSFVPLSISSMYVPVLPYGEDVPFRIIQALFGIICFFAGFIRFHGSLWPGKSGFRLSIWTWIFEIACIVYLLHLGLLPVEPAHQVIKFCSFAVLLSVLGYRSAMSWSSVGHLKRD